MTQRQHRFARYLSRQTGAFLQVSTNQTIGAMEIMKESRVVYSSCKQVAGHAVSQWGRQDETALHVLIRRQRMVGSPKIKFLLAKSFSTFQSKCILNTPS